MSETKRDDEKSHVSLEDVRRDSEGDTTEGTDKYLEDDELPPLGTRERAIAEKKLLRKLDSRLLPTIFVIYIMNYIDVRFNSCLWFVDIPYLTWVSSTSATALLPQGWRAYKPTSTWTVCFEIADYIDYIALAYREYYSDVQYATLIAILYASYCPAQIPSNMVCLRQNGKFISTDGRH